MNRATTWVLGAISGILMLYGAFILSLAGGYGGSLGCASPSGQPPCEPLQRIIISLPQNILAVRYSLLFLLLAVVIGLPAWIATPILAGRRASSARPAILIVSLIATALLAVAIVTSYVTATAYSGLTVCLTGAGPAQLCYTGTQGIELSMAGFGWASALAALLIGAPAWVMTLTQTARWRQWGWFVAALFFSPLAALLYAFFGAARPPAPAAPASPAPPQEPVPAL